MVNATMTKPTQWFLQSYTLMDGGITYALGNQWQLRIEANNLLDESYQTAAGFREPRSEFSRQGGISRLGLA